jgi:hypothetical protein
MGGRMHMRLVSAVGFLLVVTTVHAQDLPLKPEAREADDLMTADTSAPPLQEQNSPNVLIPNGMFSKVIAQPLPAKLQPVAYVGQWIAEGDQTPQFSDDLIMTERKDDGHLKWHVEKVNSCVWCGTPMTWKQAMFDKKASSMWALRSALVVADIEIAHHMLCFQAGTCRESNPLIGQTRLQGYSVGVGLTAFSWISDAWLRKGSRKYRIGGYTHWWIIPTIGDAASAIGIITDLATWKSR